MLRPVVQDFLLPTACYFGGAAEIAYFAQNSEAYRVLDRPVTPILHRQSVTVVEAKHRRTLEKFGLGFSDLLAGVDSVLDGVGIKQLSSKTSTLLDELEETLGSRLEELDENFAKVDPTISASLAKRRPKMLHHIAALRKTASRAEMRKDQTIERQIRSAFNSVFPNGQLQERVLNVHSFLNKYGDYFVSMLYEAIDLDNKDHQVIDI